MFNRFVLFPTSFGFLRFATTPYADVLRDVPLFHTRFGQNISATLTTVLVFLVEMR